MSSVTTSRRLPRRRRLVFDTAVLRDDRKGFTSVHDQMLAGEGRLLDHAKRHSARHMKAMRVAIANGLSFEQAHRLATQKVGR